MTGRNRLHRLVDNLPESQLESAERFLQYLRLSATDPVLHALLTAPEDDEPESDEEREAVAEAREDVKKGKLHSLDQLIAFDLSQVSRA